MPENYASIDIGSNAVRLLFSSVFLTSGGVIVSEKATLVRIPVRLGLDVFETGSISPFRQELLLKTLDAFRLLIEVYDPVSYRACATAAMREASNRTAVVDAIRERTGIEVEVIDGLEEAHLISSCNGFMTEPHHDWQLYVDVGGGSTELSLFCRREPVASRSFDIGTIRLLQGGVKDAAWQELKEWTKEFIPKKEKVFCIGSGGNINKLVKLYGDTTTRSVSRRLLKGALDQLSEMTMEERVERYGMRHDRADVIVHAAEIFLRIMKWGDIKRVTAPRFGLADGLAIAQFRKKSESMPGNDDTTGRPPLRC
jgi:exopolyphosphatase / guanosine-5'-triphosphate,3'-diphosphate pyrophosphatase